MRRLTMVLLLIVAPFQFIMPAAFAEDKSPWLVRLRLIDIAPHESSTVSIGGAITADIAVAPELDITYFWTDNIATELILATSKHNVAAIGTSLGDLDLGTIWVLPPTLLVQYHLNPDGQFRPYLGVGLNYTLYYNGTSGGLDSVEYDNDLGYAFQAGVDIGLNDRWAFNIDVKKVYLNANARLNGGAVTADVSLDPWVFGAGLAYRF
ncbi:MAG: hypothetical protein COB37_01490 [Kordiimonadales bacterium]|nr:MAG: hypothetical protein COB37_01490 [Kordiimonadales bacterium]